MLKKERERREKEKASKLIIDKLYKSEEIQSWFVQYHKQFDHIFNYYKNSVDYTNNKNNNKEYLHMFGFFLFCSQFNIFPGVMHSDEVQMIFRSVLKVNNDKAANALNFDEFQQALFRIAIKGPLNY